MGNWRRKEIENRSNGFIEKYESPSYLQYPEWGQYKKALGENIIHYEFIENDTVESLVQCSVHIKLKKVAIVWIPGDLCGDLKHYNKGFVDFIKKDLKVSLIYIRTFLHREKNHLLSEELNSLGWRKSSLKLDSGQTMILDLDRSIEEIKSGFRKSFRHNLNRFIKRLNNAEVWSEPSAKEVRAVFDSMENLKGLQVQYGEEELGKLLKEHKGSIFFVKSSGENGELNAIRACLIHRERAWDFLAASNDEARRSYSTFGLLWAIINECHKRGVKYYDLSGVDPINNKGVFNFKRGTGAAICNYLGEWEFSNSILLAKAIPFLLKLKKK